jgi:NAD/NADP transhydrogenase beta subunit
MGRLHRPHRFSRAKTSRCYAEGTTLLFGDAKKSVIEVAEELKAL